MAAFDCLARDCPLFGPHLLEASAGTGKTFSIEHIYVRLVLESIEVEQILAVTFTRAATRELKARIRSNLEKALHLLRTHNPAWDYLHAYLDSPHAIRNLAGALASFDRCQIFTIHGFCYRMLQEFAFEAQVGALCDPDEGKKVPQKLKEAALDFLENGIEADLLCPEQLSQITQQFDSMETLVDRLVRLEEVSLSISFLECYDQCKAALHQKFPLLTEEKLIADFRALQKNYKAMKGDFEAQVRGLAHFDQEGFRILIKEKGSLLHFLSEDNRKVRAQEVGFLNYPGFFDWARECIGPFLTMKPLSSLQSAWNPIGQKVLSEEEAWDPDAILKKMKKAIEEEKWAALIRQKYAAAVIDEFQDTDALQWEIFQKLFFTGSMKALYLVGDPKQAIYRFRKADIYTYLSAKDFLGEESVYQLETNFRSSKPLIDALNFLFARDWLHLPKAKRTLPYHPVKAGAQIEPISDGKGALHFFVAEGEPNPLFDEVFLPFAVSEIERLGLKQCAILVKDRYQAAQALDLLKERGIPAVAKSPTPLGETLAFQAIRELFEAVLFPHDASAAQVVMAGPFARKEIPFLEYKVLLEEKGLVAFARQFIQEPLSPDAMQIFEKLFEWEKKEGFSFEGLNRFLKRLRHLDPEEGGRRRMETNEEAVQILTMHISKGLEFEVVFALGLTARTPSSEEVGELEAEKLRQLYVAMTRAKKRLYVPVALSKKEAEEGTHSPMELFLRHFPSIDHMIQQESITTERLTGPVVLSPVFKKEPETLPFSLPPRSFQPFFLNSFTTLSRPQEQEVKAKITPEEGFTLQTMPRGSETGILIHQIFETLFRSSTPLWRDSAAMDALVADQIRFSFLEPWKESIQKMVREVVVTPLVANGEFFSLSEIDRFQVEMEFLFSTSPHFVKGFIDLVFCYRNRIYFLDWKTNWLEDYGPESLKKAMQAHDYELQASLYAEAVKRHFQIDFGGAFYLFVRGPASWYTQKTTGPTMGTMERENDTPFRM